MENDRELLVDVVDELKWELRPNAINIRATAMGGLVMIGVLWIALPKSLPT